jgi:isopentenyldiphosphate isomerase
MSEYMDIVNDSDQVIGRATRARVHATHAIHRGVHVFVVNHGGALLLQRRAQGRDYYPGFWDASAGGQVAAGESYEEAARRELREELGCSPGQLELVAKYDSYSDRQREKRALFSRVFDGPFRVESQEIEAVEFVSLEEIERRMETEPFTEGFRTSFALWKQFVLRSSRV